MKPLAQGTLLTPEQSARLGMLDKLTREQAVAAIVKRLRCGTQLHPRNGIVVRSVHRQYLRPIR